MQRSVALVAGGTAGHVYPALAIADAYRGAIPGVRILFIGTTGGAEARLVPLHGYRLEPVPGSPLFGVGPRAKARALADVVRGTLVARRLLKAEGVQLVIGSGGYVTAGTLLAARSLGLFTAIHEANAQPGLTNRLLGRIVQRVYLGFEAAGTAFPVGRTVVSGTPIRSEVASLAARPKEIPADRCAHVLVMGGSLGSSFLNRRAPELMTQLVRRGVRLEVRHQAGDSNPASVRAAYRGAGVKADVCRFIDDVSEAYGWADFALTCAGAGTLAELAAVGLPSLLVPLSSASEDHQVANAKAFAETTGGAWVCEQAWHADELADQVVALLSDSNAWAAASARARRLARTAAAHDLVADCERCLIGRAR
jgi:UDP-N-acetylglucosamine--N-acetylmuramyl-(pentapeptide) pyrophosphoryl-undecaprenol N-acetylglucosamine transferase